MTSFTLTKENITFVLNEESHTLPIGKNFQKVMEFIKKGKFQEILKLLSPKKVIEQTIRGLQVISSEQIRYNGKDFNEREYRGAVKWVIDCVNKKLPYEYVLKFLENLSMNPDANSKLNIFNFMMHTGILITENGYIAAVKAVNGNLYDHHTKTFKNEIGTFVKEKRENLDNNPNVGCGRGLHVGSSGYVYGFRSDSRILLVLLHPKDVVSIPKDESFQKLRCCKYYVAMELLKDQKSDWENGKLPTNIHKLVIDFDKEVITDETAEYVKAAESAKKQIKKANKKNKVESKKSAPVKQSVNKVPQKDVKVEKQNTQNITIVLKTISRNRLSLPTTVLKQIHAVSGDELFLFSKKDKLILSKKEIPNEESTCVYKVDRDGQLCISEIRLKEISNGMFFRINIVKNTIEITTGGKK